MISPPAVPSILQVPETSNFRDATVALLVLDDGRYLMQLRDNKPDIFFPNLWGLFGGAVDPGEDPETALRRELMEELSLEPASVRYFTRMDFDFGCLGAGACYRIFYEVPLPAGAVSALRLGEGQCMEPLAPSDIRMQRQSVPYDFFAIWLHYARRQRAQAA
jgi:8-oxo-dGTP pyrophosphatase MutT (NUDIX family)